MTSSKPSYLPKVPLPKTTMGFRSFGDTNIQSITPTQPARAERRNILQRGRMHQLTFDLALWRGCGFSVLGLVKGKFRGPFQRASF